MGLVALKFDIATKIIEALTDYLDPMTNNILYSLCNILYEAANTIQVFFRGIGGCSGAHL